MSTEIPVIVTGLDPSPTNAGAPEAGRFARRSLMSGGIYALASAGQRVVAFLLLPVYTTVLSPADYGRLSVLLTIVGGAVVVMGAGLDYSVLRGYVEREHDRVAQRRFVTSVWFVILVGAPVLAALSVVVFLVLFPETKLFTATELALALFGAAVLVSATTVPMAVLRAGQRLRPYVILSMTSVASNAALTLIAVVWLRLGVTGWLLATLLSAALSLGAAMILLPWSWPEQVDRRGVRDALGRGLPLLPHAVSQWSLQLADRAVLSGLVVPAALGVYSLGANLALPSMVLILGLNQGFLPSYARARGDAGAVLRLRPMITLHVAIVCLIGLATSLLGPPLVSLLLDQAYRDAGPLIPWVTLGYVFLGLYFVPMNALSLIAGRTKFIWPLTATAAALNLGCIFLFVPSYGILAAAISSAIGYLALLVGVSLFAVRTRVSIDIDWRQVVTVAAWSGLVYAVGAFATPSTGVVSLAGRSALTVLFACALGVAASSSRRRIRRAK